MLIGVGLSMRVRIGHHLAKIVGIGKRSRDHLGQTARGATQMTAGYKLATYQSADGPRAGLVRGDKIFDAANLTGKPAYGTVVGILSDWKAAQGALKAATAKATKAKGQPLTGAKLLAPVLWPSAIYCAGANYADHAAEMSARHGRPPEPDPHTLGLQSCHFIKAPRSIANPGQTVKAADYSKQLDWEIEL